MAPDRDRFLADILQNPINRALLERLPAFGLKDAWLVSGCLFQTVWNIKSGNVPTHGIRDYDIFYFDADDVSWEAENEDIRRVAGMVGDLAATVELKNQARVHLWYGERFGPGYPQLNSAKEGVDLFLSCCTRVAVRPGNRGAVDLYAPDGLDDLYEGVLRPNPLNHRPALFRAKVDSYRERWPWLRVEDRIPT